MREEFLWVEKYRPQTIDECVLPDRLKKIFQEFVDNNQIPNLLLHGGSGIGKTTVARALCQEVGCDSIVINGSEESGIDVLRKKITSFATTVSLTSLGIRKMVILDEADYLHQQSTQPALRGAMEEFSKNCGFILTCNYHNRIMPAIHSRCSVIDFSIKESEKENIKISFIERVKDILAAESIPYQDSVLEQLSDQFMPDLRRILNELQKSAAGGVIDADSLVNYETVSINDLCLLMKQKNFEAVRKWVVENQDNEPTVILRQLYDSLSDMLKPDSVPGAVVIIADYSYKTAFVSDQEINLVSCLVELMANCEFK